MRIKNYLNFNLYISYFASISSSVVGFVFLPLYLKHLSLEDFGVVGFMTTIQIWITIIDFGFPTILSREIAKNRNNTLNRSSVLFFTIERYFLSVIFILLAASLINSIFKLSYSGSLISNHLFYILMMVSLRMMENIYKSVLIAFEKHVSYNSLVIFFVFLRAFSTLGALIYISSTLVSFFLAQISITGILVITLRYRVFSVFPKDSLFKFELNRLKEIKSVSLGLFGTSVVTLLVTSFDKLYLPKIISLSDYGIYMIFVTITGIFYSLLSPLINLWFPSFCEKVSKNDSIEISESFYQITKQITAVLGTLIIFVFVYANNLLSLYFHDIILTPMYFNLFKLMLISVLLNIYFYIPYELQVANSWTSLIFKTNLISAFFIIPASILLYPKYGVIISPILIILLHFGYIVFQLPIIFRRYKYLNFRMWSINGIVFPLIVIYLFYFFIYKIFNLFTIDSKIISFIGLSISFLIGFSLSLIFLYSFWYKKIKIFINR